MTRTLSFWENASDVAERNAPAMQDQSQFIFKWDECQFSVTFTSTNKRLRAIPVTVAVTVTMPPEGLP